MKHRGNIEINTKEVMKKMKERKRDKQDIIDESHVLKKKIIKWCKILMNSDIQSKKADDYILLWTVIECYITD